MNASDVYKALLKELDKFESPTFTISDFNYFFTVSINKYITDNYSDFDVLQKDIDDIAPLLVYDRALTITDFSASLPDDYLHNLGIELKVKFIKDTRDYKAGDIIKAYPKRLRSNRKGYASDNAYQQPSYEYPFYRMNATSFSFLLGEDVEIESGTIDYIKKPDPVYLNPDRTSDYNDPANNTPIQFSDVVTYEIIEVCRQVFLENIESPRYQTSLQENQLNNLKE